MREIKFRAWDGTKMLDVGSILGEGGSFWEEYGLHEKQVVLMQYTGMTDAHKNEIWEGDIVNYHETHYRDKNTETVDLYEIKWSEGNAGFWCGGVYPLTQGQSQDIEVIGNIYEEPELINASQEAS